MLIKLSQISESFSMYHALNKAGAGVELHVFDGAPHAFDRLAEFAKPCVQLITLFFDRKVVNPRTSGCPGCNRTIILSIGAFFFLNFYSSKRNIVSERRGNITVCSQRKWDNGTQ